MFDETLRDKLSQLEGLISEDVGLKLASIASRVPRDRAIVEVGSYKGKSTCYLAAGSSAGEFAPVFAVDPWDLPGNVGGRFGFDRRATRADFYTQVQHMGFMSQITALRGFSAHVAQTWKMPIGFLYIDGSHTEKDVRKDWHVWSPYLTSKSVVAFDDYDTPRNPGVKKVVDEIRAEIPKSRWEFGPAPLMVGRLP